MPGSLHDKDALVTAVRKAIGRLPIAPSQSKKAARRKDHEMTTLDTTESTTTYPNTPLHIDIPVKLDEVKSVFSVAALSFEGDLPASLFHLGLITDDIADWDASSKVVVVFHTNAGHVTLDHPAYNADRGIETGNPYKELVTNLMSRGVQVELCGATAKAHHYGNADLIPGITVNTDAMARTTQLVQQGFVKISED